MPLKGFLLTTDAILALAIISSAVIASAVLFKDSDYFNHASSLDALARDYLMLKGRGLIDAAKFKELTGVTAYDSLDGVPESAAFVVHGEMYAYPLFCNGVSPVQAGSSCLQYQELDETNFRNGVWVTP